MSMRLIILGLLMEGEKHPYEVQLLMQHRNMDKYIKFQKGSLYYAFQRLEKESLIEVSHVVKDSSRPDRTIYRITEAGKTEFERVLLKQLTVMEPYYDPMYAALAFCRNADPQVLTDILEHKVKVLEKVLEEVRKIYQANLNLSPANLRIMEGGVRHTETELEWLREVYEDAKAGNLF